MRILIIARFATEKFNAAVRDRTAGSKVKKILDDVKPETVYFTELNGRRAVLMAVELDEPSKIPALAEPWFLMFDAEIELHVAMTPDDLQSAGLERLGEQWA